MESFIGRTIGKYKIIQHLGRGGMAEVYKGYQEALERNVAIKMMHTFLASESDFLSRFKREARSMASLNHPNIVGVYDFDVQGDTYYIVMEFVGGGTLKERLEEIAANGETLPMARAVQIILEIADALSYAHSRGMVHRDIKPANIMLREDGRAVLTDFGIAKMMSGQSYTATGAMIGTPAYMSPEQGLGQGGDERSDLYALGVLFFQMATGRLPYDADTPLAVVLKHVNDPVPLPVTFNRSVPSGVQEIIVKAMAKDSNERYQTAHDFARSLREAIRREDINLAQALPVDLMEDKPTPPPLATSAVRTQASPVGPTRISPNAPPVGTVLSPGPTQLGAPPTMIGGPPIDRTEVAAAPMRAIPQPAETAAPARRRSPWLLLGAAGVVLLIILAAVVGGIALAGRGAEATPTTQAVVAAGTDTRAAPTSTTEPTVTVDFASGVSAALTEIAQNAPTNTAEPTVTWTPTPTDTPDATATHLAGCQFAVALTDAYAYNNRDFDRVTVGAQFPMNWILRNSGTCPWPAGLEWTYVSGEEFDQQGPVPVTNAASPNEEMTLTTQFRAPNQAGEYEATWQMVEGDSQPFGEPLTFSLTAVPAQTATPRPQPTATGPAVTPTGVEFPAVGLTVGDPRNCEYAGDNWRCTITLIPYGGGGGPYTVWVFDTVPEARYFGPGPFDHIIVARRCFAWVHNIIVQDEATGRQYPLDLFFEPDNLFTGGCVEP